MRADNLGCQLVETHYTGLGLYDGLGEEALSALLSMHGTSVAEATLRD